MLNYQGGMLYKLFRFAIAPSRGHELKLDSSEGVGDTSQIAPSRGHELKLLPLLSAVLRVQ